MRALGRRTRDAVAKWVGESTTDRDGGKNSVRQELQYQQHENGQVTPPKRVVVTKEGWPPAGF